MLRDALSPGKCDLVLAESTHQAIGKSDHDIDFGQVPARHAEFREMLHRRYTAPFHYPHACAQMGAERMNRSEGAPERKIYYEILSI